MFNFKVYIRVFKNIMSLVAMMSIIGVIYFFSTTSEMIYRTEFVKSSRFDLTSNIFYVKVIYKGSITFDVNLNLVYRLIVWFLILHIFITVLCYFRFISYISALVTIIFISFFIVIIVLAFKFQISETSINSNLSILISNVIFKKLAVPLILDRKNSYFISYLYGTLLIVCLYKFKRYPIIKHKVDTQKNTSILYSMSTTVIMLCMLTMTLSWFRFLCLVAFIALLLVRISTFFTQHRYLDRPYNNYFLTTTLNICIIKLLMWYIVLISVDDFCVKKNIYFPNLLITNTGVLEYNTVPFSISLIILAKLLYIRILFLLYDGTSQLKKDETLPPVMAFIHSGIFFIPGIYLLVRLNLFSIITNNFLYYVIFAILIFLLPFASYRKKSNSFLTRIVLKVKAASLDVFFNETYFYDQNEQSPSKVLNRVLNHYMFFSLIFTYLLFLLDLPYLGMNYFLFSGLTKTLCFVVAGNILDNNIKKKFYINLETMSKYIQFVSLFLSLITFVIHFKVLIVYLEAVNIKGFFILTSNSASSLIINKHQIFVLVVFILFMVVGFSFTNHFSQPKLLKIDSDYYVYFTTNYNNLLPIITTFTLFILWQCFEPNYGLLELNKELTNLSYSFWYIQTLLSEATIELVLKKKAEWVIWINIMKTNLIIWIKITKIKLINWINYIELTYYRKGVQVFFKGLKFFLSVLFMTYSETQTDYLNEYVDYTVTWYKIDRTYNALTHIWIQNFVTLTLVVFFYGTIGILVIWQIFILFFAKYYKYTEILFRLSFTSVTNWFLIKKLLNFQLSRDFGLNQVSLNIFPQMDILTNTLNSNLQINAATSSTLYILYTINILWLLARWAVYIYINVFVYEKNLKGINDNSFARESGVRYEILEKSLFIKFYLLQTVLVLFFLTNNLFYFILLWILTDLVLFIIVNHNLKIDINKGFNLKIFKLYVFFICISAIIFFSELYFVLDTRHFSYTINTIITSPTESTRVNIYINNLVISWLTSLIGLRVYYYFTYIVWFGRYTKKFINTSTLLFTVISTTEIFYLLIKFFDIFLI